MMTQQTGAGFQICPSYRLAIHLCLGERPLMRWVWLGKARKLTAYCGQRFLLTPCYPDDAERGGYDHAPHFRTGTRGESEDQGQSSVFPRQ